MTQALITVNGSPGPDDDLPINTLVTLSNQNNGGEVSYLWSIVTQPPGTTDSLSSTVVLSPTFTPKKEGTYLIRLVVNQGLASETYQQTVCAVRFLKSFQRAPAAGESTEDSLTEGWALAVNEEITAVDAQLKSVDVVAVADASVGANDLVYFSAVSTIKAGLPGEETLPTAVLADVTTLPAGAVVGFLTGATDGGAVGVGEVVRVRLYGIVHVAGTFTAAAPVYLTTVGAFTSTSTDVKVGYCLATSGGFSDIYLNTPSSSALASAPRSAKIVVGNSVVGDTLADCDYLDTGNGAAIVTALAAAATYSAAMNPDPNGHIQVDVFLRPGRYLLATAAAQLVVPTYVTLRGANASTTFIGAPGGTGISPWRAVSMLAGSTVRDLGFVCQAISGTATYNSTIYGVIEVAGANCTVKNIRWHGGSDTLTATAAMTRALVVVTGTGAFASGLVVDDITVDFTGCNMGASVNLAIAGVSVGTNSATQDSYAPVAGITRAQIRNVTVINRSYLTASRRFDGVYLLSNVYANVEGITGINLVSPLTVLYRAQTATRTSPGPNVNGISNLYPSAVNEAGGAGIFIQAVDNGFACAIFGVSLRNVDCAYDGAAAHAAVISHPQIGATTALSSITHVDVDGVTLYDYGVGSSCECSIQGSAAGAVDRASLRGVSLYGSSAEIIVGTGAATHVSVTGCRTLVLTIGANATNTIVVANQIAAAGYTDHGTGTQSGLNIVA